MRYTLSVLLLLWGGMVLAQGAKPAAPSLPRSAAPEGAAVYIISPRDGEVVGSTFTVVFGLRGMGIAPAGLKYPNTGHHHLLINTKTFPPMDRTLPSTEQLRHYGGGQTETVLTLPPGRHSLQLLLGDYLHIPHQPPVLSRKINILVK